MIPPVFRHCWPHRAIRLAVIVALGLATFQPAVAQAPRSSEQNQLILRQHGKRDLRVHDPSSIVKCNGEYWLFATGGGIETWRSKNLQDWQCGSRVFATMPSWVTEVVPTQRGYFWAPDVLFRDGLYWLYYSVSCFGVNTSAIGLATNKTLDPEAPDYQWQDQGIVVRSHSEDNFNAIDPAVLQTDDGGLWMSFGSFWSGIKLVPLDPATGLRLSADGAMHSLAWSPSIEAPCIVHHGEYYYLFVNWGTCCRGVHSTYNIRVGRSHAVTGPYVDSSGVDLARGGGTLFLETDGPFIGPGHASVLQDDDRYWFSCHYYDETERGRSRLAMVPLTWSHDGWPHLPQNGLQSACEVADPSP